MSVDYFYCSVLICEPDTGCDQRVTSGGDAQTRHRHYMSHMTQPANHRAELDISITNDRAHSDWRKIRIS